MMFNTTLILREQNFVEVNPWGTKEERGKCI